MSEETPGVLSLRTIGGGGAIELVDAEIRSVVENIIDPNTEATAARKITLTLTFKPDKERKSGEVEVACSSKIAPATSFATRAYFGKQGDLFIAYEDNPKQITFEQFAESNNSEGVVPIAPAKEGNGS